ncbi:MAG: hypothetical protein AAF628_15630 [Planctomycetota bacterium]
MSTPNHVTRLAWAPLATLLLAGAGNAQALAGAHTFGIGATGTSKEPLRMTSEAPVIGASMRINIEQGPPGLPGAGWFANGLTESFQPVQLPGGNSIYLDLATASSLFSFTTDASGGSDVSLPIPPIPSLAGALFPTQALVIDPGNAFGAVFSNANLLAIGNGAAQAPQFVAESWPIDDDFRDKVESSALTASYVQAVQSQGLGKISFEHALEVRYDGDVGSPLPADARFVIAPVEGNSGTNSFYLYTSGTDARGFREGAELMTLQTTPGGGQAISFMMGEELQTQINVELESSGEIKSVQMLGELGPYERCFGLCFAALVAGGTISGLSAGCKAACSACFVPPHASCVVCAGCAIFVAGYSFGCWWGC